MAQGGRWRRPYIVMLSDACSPNMSNLKPPGQARADDEMAQISRWTVASDTAAQSGHPHVTSQLLLLHHSTIAYRAICKPACAAQARITRTDTGSADSLRLRRACTIVPRSDAYFDRDPPLAHAAAGIHAQSNRSRNVRLRTTRA